MRLLVAASPAAYNVTIEAHNLRTYCNFFHIGVVLVQDFWPDMCSDHQTLEFVLIAPTQFLHLRICVGIHDKVSNFQIWLDF